MSKLLTSLLAAVFAAATVVPVAFAAEEKKGEAKEVKAEKKKNEEKKGEGKKKAEEKK
jgi:Ni/Co efflux regulator RcnB